MQQLELELDEAPETGVAGNTVHRIRIADTFRSHGTTWCVFQCSCGYDSPLIAGRLNARQAWITHRDGAS